MTKDDELWYLVQDIVREHTKQIYFTPYATKQIIPQEEIYALKQDFFKLLQRLTKGNNKD